MNRNLIQWNRAQYWDKPWNPIVGCVPVSPACAHCYANSIANRFGMGDFSTPHKTTRTNPPKTGVVFCGNMTDLFGEWVGIGEQMDFFSKLWHFNGPHSSPQPNNATYLFLTKRPRRMLEACRNYASIPHAFLGFTAENQDMFDERWNIWQSLKPGWVNGWLSAEPLLGPLSLHLRDNDDNGLIKWVVVGCESGPKRRPCKIEWVEEIVRECQVHNIPVFVKQLDIGGECVRDIEKFPQHLRIRQVPWAKEGGAV